MSPQSSGPKSKTRRNSARIQVASSVFFFMLVYCLAYFSTLKIETIIAPEISVDFQWNTWRYITQDGTLHNLWCQNLKSYKLLGYIVRNVDVSTALLHRQDLEIWEFANCHSFKQSPVEGFVQNCVYTISTSAAGVLKCSPLFTRLQRAVMGGCAFRSSLTWIRQLNTLSDPAVLLPCYSTLALYRVRFRGFRLTQHFFNSCLLFYSNYPLHVSVVRLSSGEKIWSYDRNM
jgi:hypothetical protein